MDPRRPMCRETEEAGLGRRGGPTGWNPLPPGGAVGRQELAGSGQIQPTAPHSFRGLCPSLLPPVCLLQSPTKATMLCLALNIALVPFVQLMVQTQKPHLYTQKTPAPSLPFPADPLDNTALDRGILSLHRLFPWNFLLLVLPLSLVRVSRFPSQNGSSWETVYQPF